MAKNSRQNFKYPENEKMKTFKMKWISSLIIFKRLSFKQIKQMFLEGESPTLIQNFTKIWIFMLNSF